MRRRRKMDSRLTQDTQMRKTLEDSVCRVPGMPLELSGGASSRKVMRQALSLLHGHHHSYLLLLPSVPVIQPHGACLP